MYTRTVHLRSRKTSDPVFLYFYTDRSVCLVLWFPSHFIPYVTSSLSIHQPLSYRYMSLLYIAAFLSTYAFPLHLSLFLYYILSLYCLPISLFFSLSLSFFIPLPPSSSLRTYTCIPLLSTPYTLPWLYISWRSIVSRDFTYSHDCSWAVFCLVDGHCHVYFSSLPFFHFAFRDEINRWTLSTVWTRNATLTKLRNLYDKWMIKLRPI